MSKSYKKKKVTEVTSEETDTLSKKELYDLNKKKKEEAKTKKDKKGSKKKKKDKKHYQTNLGGRIFAVIMLILMIGSVVASALAYLAR